MNETPAEETPAAESAEPESKEQISAFVPMDFFQGRNPKEGDTETVRIVSVDPESGEVEVVCEYGGEKGRSKSMMDMMDEEMPEEA